MTPKPSMFRKNQIRSWKTLKSTPEQCLVDSCLSAQICAELKHDPEVCARLAPCEKDSCMHRQTADVQHAAMNER